MAKPSSSPMAPDSNGLAFALATAARPALSPADADRIYIAIGVGDTFEAIAALIAVLARERVPISKALISTTATWLDSYRGQDCEPHLRQLLVTLPYFSAPTVSCRALATNGAVARRSSRQR